MLSRRGVLAAIGWIIVLIAGFPRGAHATPLGSSALYPAFSAKEILQAGASLGDGLYWFDPDGPGGLAAYQGYADMTTAGGGWNLALLSLRDSPSATTDIVSNTGTPGLSSGQTRDMTLLAVAQSAEIRHEIILGAQEFDGYYTGKYHDALPLLAAWTQLTDSNTTSFLDYHFGRPWTTVTNDQDAYSGNCATLFGGAPWYYGACWVTIPSSLGGLYPPGPRTSGGTVALDSYAIWVRADGQTLYADPEAVVATPEPASLILCGSGLLGIRRLLRRRQLRTAATPR